LFFSFVDQFKTKTFHHEDHEAHEESIIMDVSTLFPFVLFVSFVVSCI